MTPSARAREARRVHEKHRERIRWDSKRVTSYVSQAAVEVLIYSIHASVSQAVPEVLLQPTPVARVSQAIVEVAVQPPDAYVSQAVIEVLIDTP